ncbi:UNVERIFIED_CONTAM: hypothetical protein O8I53_11600 [Campylobacter lari]
MKKRSILKVILPTSLTSIFSIPFISASNYEITPKYTISFNSNGAEGNMDDVLLENGQILPKNKFYKNGYHFIG